MLGSVVLSVVLTASAGTRTEVVLPGRVVEVDSAETGRWQARLRAGHDGALAVRVVTDGGDFVRGFGLQAGGRARVDVERSSVLVLENRGTEPVTVRVGSRPLRDAPPPAVSRVAFTLRNTTGASIPLRIPGVMNPNLSPNSNSGVELAIGQAVLFRDGARWRVLFVVDDTIAGGSVVDVAALLAEREAA